MQYTELVALMDEHRTGPGKARFNHEILDKHCTGSSRSAILSETDDGISLHCFRCGVNYLALKPSCAAARSARQILVQAYQEVTGFKHAYPEGEADFLAWPLDVRNWALSSVNVKSLRGIMARWDWELRRLWLPVFLDGTPVRWTGRNFGDPDRPKYLSGRLPEYVYHDPVGSGRTVVLVEDILGAHRLAERLPVRAYPIMGTAVAPMGLLKLSERAEHGVVWLDNDNTQVLQARRKLVKQLKGYGMDVTVYRGDHDPKREPRLLTAEGRREIMGELDIRR